MNPPKKIFIKRSDFKIHLEIDVHTNYKINKLTWYDFPIEWGETVGDDATIEKYGIFTSSNISDNLVLILYFFSVNPNELEITNGTVDEVYQLIYQIPIPKMIHGENARYDSKGEIIMDEIAMYDEEGVMQDLFHRIFVTNRSEKNKRKYNKQVVWYYHTEPRSGFIFIHFGKKGESHFFLTEEIEKYGHRTGEILWKGLHKDYEGNPVDAEYGWHAYT